MKNSILKKIVSVFAVATMLITSTAVALAENDYASQTSDCSAKTNWGLGGTSSTGFKHTITDGMFRSERTIFRKGGTWYKADGNGGMTTATESPNAISTYVFGGQKTFTKGMIQAKFDFMFEGGTGQSISAAINGTTDHSAYNAGIRIYKDNLRMWYPTDAVGSAIYYDAIKTVLTDGAWYTCTMSYDIDKRVIKATITGNGLSFSTSTTITDSGWPTKTVDGKTVPRDKGNISGIRFCSYRDFDQFDAVTGKSVWYIDNVSIDAYTKTNYEIESIYKSADGIETNKNVDGFDLKGYTFSKLTNFNTPASARFVTASYDGTGRMINAIAKPIPAAGTPVVTTVDEGTTIKPFVFDMSNAGPLTTEYKYADPSVTVRSVDFNEGCSVITTQDKGTITTHGNYNYPVADKDVVVGTENGALKFERSVFREGSGSTAKGYHYDENGTKVMHTTDDAIAHTQSHYKLKFDKTVNSAHASLRFKFAGIDATGYGQMITISFGNGDNTPGEVLLRINRKPDGSGILYSGAYPSLSALTTWTAGEMKADTWYTFDFTYTYDTTAAKGKITNGTITGNGFSKTFSKDGVSVDIPQNFNYITIFSHRDSDRASTADTATIKTSVWYIDDLKVEY